MKQIKISILMLAVFTLLCGIAYPLAVTGIGMIFFHDKTNGSIITKKRYNTRLCAYRAAVFKT